MTRRNERSSSGHGPGTSGAGPRRCPRNGWSNCPRAGCAGHGGHRRHRIHRAHGTLSARVAGVPRLMRSIMTTWVIVSERWGVGFVVAGEVTAVHEAAEGPLDQPASRDHLEAFDAGFAGGDFDVDAGACAVSDGFGAVAGVGPGFGHGRVGGGDVGDQVRAADVAGNACRGDRYGREQAEGVHSDMALAACGSLPASMPWPAAGTLLEVFTLCASSRSLAVVQRVSVSPPVTAITSPTVKLESASEARYTYAGATSSG